MKSATSPPPSSALRRSISTPDGRLVWRPIHREFFRDHPEKFDLREPGKIFMPAYAEYVIHKNQALGSAGHLEEVRGVISK